MSHLKKCNKKGLLNTQKFVHQQLQYECIMGSNAYGVASDNSDLDIYGFCIPYKDHIVKTIINGFDKPEKYFEQYQQHHIKAEITEYDFSIYNITKYFSLCMDGNPNMIDSLFVPENCVTFITPIGQLIRDNRKIFLSKKCWHTFKGYSYSQLHKMKIKNPNKNSKRYDSIIKYGYDVKFAYHIVRLLEEVSQILIEGDLDLQRNREQLKSIRRGEWTIEDIMNHFETNQKNLEKIYYESNLNNKPRTEEIRELLVKCLKMHFGDDIFEGKKISFTETIIDDILAVIKKYQ